VTDPGSGNGPITGLANKCLDIRGGLSADATPAQLYTCNGSLAQLFARAGQTLRVKGKCLDIAGGATADGTKVQLYTCNSSGAQKWVPQADGTLKNPQSNKCLDVTGANSADSTPVQLYTCGTSAAQKWSLN
jgi:hypothetical protein